MHHQVLYGLIAFYLRLIDASTELRSNESILMMERINGLLYGYRIHVMNEQADFSFTIRNVTYAKTILHIDAYYLSINFHGGMHYEERTESIDIPSNETIYHGELKMQNLVKDGNYFVCVLFLTRNRTNLIGSSRFCHLIALSKDCNLENSDDTFDNQNALIVGLCAVVFLLSVFIISVIRNHVYRPRTIEAILKTLPSQHEEMLKNLADVAHTRRQRKPQNTLSNRLREDSVVTVDYDGNIDHDYHKYHGWDSTSLDIVDELDNQ
jgi:hypothetical protein